MNGSRIFKVVLGSVIAAAVAFISVRVLYPDGVTFTVTNRLGAAQCVMTFDSDPAWTFSIKPAETITRLVLDGPPELVLWTCSTAEGVVTGGEYGCGFPVQQIDIRHRKQEDYAFC